METWAFIEQIGRDLGATDNIIKKWRMRGVSNNWHARVLFAAKERGRELTLDDLGRPERPTGKAAA